LKIASYALEKSANGSFRLVRSETPLFQADRIQESVSEILATGVLEWKLEFYDSRNDQWNPEWDSGGTRTGNRFPQAVRVELEVVDPRLPPDEWNQKSLRYETKIRVLNEYALRQ